MSIMQRRKATNADVPPFDGINFSCSSKSNNLRLGDNRPMSCIIVIKFIIRQYTSYRGTI